MQSRNRLFDDLARVANGALGVAAGMREEIDARMREQVERELGRLDLVTREEFDAVRAMAVKAREEQEALLARIADLEGKLAARGTPQPAKRGTGAKTAPSKPKPKPKAKPDA